jgi:Dehydrogenases with different specificities (related to short-chain alcohol dehydrogenases)
MPVTYDFSGRVAVVTGGANGIGREVARRLSHANCRVAVWDLVAPDLPDVTGYRVDVTRPETISTALEATLATYGGVDILVQSAGYAGPTVPVEAYDPAEWRRLVEVNLIGVYEVARLVVPHMRKRPFARIINIASLAGKEGTPNSSAYSAAKAGVIAFTKALGKELADTNIRVNCIAPAAIETELLKQMAPEHVEIMIAKSPMKRLGTVAECAELVLWLASEACTFNTGAVFDLSGDRATY